jgi:hypothetical protein
MTEIWVPYGPVEVSFDIRQENLSQILEPQPAKIAPEELDIVADRVTEEVLLVLSGTLGVQKFLDVLLTRNKGIKKIMYLKALGALCRRKAQEFSLQSEQLSLVDGENPEGALRDLKNIIPSLEFQKVLLLSSVHYDPLFGLSSSASEVMRLVTELKKRAFSESSDELPCPPEKSNASDFALKQFESLSSVRSIELIEKTGVGILGISHGDVKSVHLKSLELWQNTLAIPVQKSERVIFGCGGSENDKNLTEAFGRALFPVLMNVALSDSDSKICMLAECGSGLGSEAFLKFVTGRLEPRSKIGGVDYVEGLEVLLSFQKLQREFELNILTTLPKYYALKFDLKTIGGARQAPSSLLSPGSRAKILVLPDASCTFFKA